MSDQPTATKPLEEMTPQELKQTIRKKQQIICTNTEISSHILDLMIRELHALQAELHAREV